MNLLASEGDAFVEGYRVGRQVKGIMFDCDFNDDCFYERLDDLIAHECQTFENFNMVDYRECEKTFYQLFKRIYQHNKQVMGY